MGWFCPHRSPRFPVTLSLYLAHLTGWMAPALGVALCLTAVLFFKAGLPRTHLVHAFGWLMVAGLLTLALGFVFHGRDGAMGTYASLVLVTGLVAAWLDRKHPPRR